MSGLFKQSVETIIRRQGDSASAIHQITHALFKMNATLESEGKHCMGQ